MTREEAIKHLLYDWFAPLDGQFCVDADKKDWFCEAIGIAITALRAQQEPNAPLTLEELREMDGEPVWNDTMKKWVIVDLFWEHGPRTVDARGRWRDFEDRYYRRRPEEEAV